MKIDYRSTGWQDFPEGISAAGQVFAVPDIHGRARVLDEALATVEALPPPAPGTPRALVFLGDVTDRGYENFEAIDLVIGARIENGQRLVVCGNHDGMLLDGIDLPMESGAFKFWHDNGGYAVLDGLPCGGTGSPAELRRKLIQALDPTWLAGLRLAPSGAFRSHFISGDLLFIHAGIPGYGQVGNRDEEELCRFLSQPLAGATQLRSPKPHWAWMRPQDPVWTRGWDADRRRVVIHGHTNEYRGPIDSDAAVFAGIDKVGSERRISLDLFGISGGRLAVLEALDASYRFHLFEDHVEA